MIGNLITAVFISLLFAMVPSTVVLHWGFDYPWAEALRWSVPMGVLALLYVGSTYAKELQSKEETEVSDGNGV